MGTAESLQSFRGVRETRHISSWFTVHSECSVISTWVSSGNEIPCSGLRGSHLGLPLAFTGGGCGNRGGFGLQLSDWLVLSHADNGQNIELCLLIAQNERF